VGRVRCAGTADTENVVSLVRSAYRGPVSRQGWTSEADFVEGDRIDAAQVSAMIADPDCRLLVLADADGLLACCQVLDLDGWCLSPRGAASAS